MFQLNYFSPFNKLPRGWGPCVFIYLFLYFFFFSHFELVLVKERELLKTGEGTLYFS